MLWGNIVKKCKIYFSLFEKSEIFYITERPVKKSQLS